MIWDTAKEQMLIELFNKGLSAALIAAELGVSRNAVIGKSHRMKLQRETIRIARNVRIPKQPPPQPTAVPQTIEKLQADQCRWPMTDDPRAQLYCARRPLAVNSSYCEHHERISKSNKGQSKWQSSPLPLRNFQWK